METTWETDLLDVVERCEATAWGAEGGDDAGSAVADAEALFTTILAEISRDLGDGEEGGTTTSPFSRRTDTLCAVVRVMLDTPDMTPSTALTAALRTASTYSASPAMITPLSPLCLSDRASRLLDAIGANVLAPLVSAADAANTPAAEALAVAVVDAMAAACGPRDTYVMILEALQRRLVQVSPSSATADDDNDNDNALQAGANGWRLAGALTSALATLVSRMRRKPAIFATDAVPLVLALANAANEREQQRADDVVVRETGRTGTGTEGRGRGWGTPAESFAGMCSFVLASADAVSRQKETETQTQTQTDKDKDKETTAATTRSASATRVLALSVAALDPRPSMTVTTSSTTGVITDVEEEEEEEEGKSSKGKRVTGTGAAVEALRRIGVENLDHLCALVWAEEEEKGTRKKEEEEEDQEEEEEDDDDISWSSECVVGAALVTHAWVLSAELATPHPSPLTPSGPLHAIHATTTTTTMTMTGHHENNDAADDGDNEAQLCAAMSLESLAPLVDALLPSPLAPSHFPSGLQLAALAFRRCTPPLQCDKTFPPSSSSSSSSKNVMSMLTKLEVTMARVPDARLRETARLALSRALGCVASVHRLEIIKRLLEAPPPSSAVAALLLTRLKRDAAAEWPRATTNNKGARVVDAEEVSGSSSSVHSPFASPAMISLVEGQIGRALDASRGGSGGRVGRSGANAAAWLLDPSGAADVIGAALNVLRFVLMRESASTSNRCDDSFSTRAGGGGRDVEESRSMERATDHTGVWRRRQEVRRQFVIPAMEWAEEHLKRITTAAAATTAGSDPAVEVVDDGEGGGEEEKAAWEAQMGLHHVAEVGRRIVEFITESK